MNRLTIAASAAALAFGGVRSTGAQERPIVLRAVRLLDIQAGRLVSPALVVVHNGRIVNVGGTAPQGAETIDLGDMTLLPGLMDMHTHLTGDIEGNWVYRPVTATVADDALRGARNARRTLGAGFTTVRDVGSRDFVDVALMKATDADMIPGPRIFPAGHSLGITGGHCDVTGFKPGLLEQDWRSGVADGPDEASKAVRHQAKYGAKVIKICATAGVLSFEESVGAQQFRDAEIRAVVEEAAAHDLHVAAHAHGTDGIKAAVRAGVASIEHGSILDDEGIRLMLERGTFLVPTSYLADVIDKNGLPPPIRAKAEIVLLRMRESLRRAIQAGVKVAFGTDASVYPHGDNAREFAVYVQQGMTPIDAIRTATTRAAELLGVTDRGVIAEGKPADIIAVPGDPLQNVRVLEDVRFVMKNGRVYLCRKGGDANHWGDGWCLEGDATPEIGLAVDAPGGLQMGAEAAGIERAATRRDGVDRCDDAGSERGLEGHRRLVDIGGANGPFAVAALQHARGLRAVVFDLREVWPYLEESRRRHGLMDRLDFVAGDFFVDELPEGDLLALGYVLSNWPDQECRRLLAKIHCACAAGGKVLVMERLFNDSRVGPLSTAAMNLEMQVETRGRHRTTAEYFEMLSDAGFVHPEVRRSSRDKHLLIGHKLF